MGGAGMPAYQKWLDVWQQPGTEKYVVCNGDESEPGTFKDREILLRMPHLVVEGVILAGLMTGGTAGYIYVRHEYFEQIHALREEVKRAEELGRAGRTSSGPGGTSRSRCSRARAGTSAASSRR
jgi:NADH:ubiquinone oxidoreductase subunit F (NADH-binding)